MPLKSLFASLRFRITFAVTLVLIVILGAATVWRYWNHTQLDMEEAQHQAAVASSLVSASVQHALLTQDRADLQSIMDNVSRQRGILGIYLVNATGVLELTGISSATSALPTQGEFLSLVSSNDADIRASQSRVYTDRSGNQILRYINVIANEPQCHSCHDATQQRLGAFVTDYALTETNYQITTDLQGSIATGLISILAVVLAVNLLLNRFVLDKLRQFNPVLLRVGEGDLSQRLTPREDDEIGQLAVHFNRMADGLETRARENAQLYTQLE